MWSNQTDLVINDICRNIGWQFWKILFVSWAELRKQLDVETTITKTKNQWLHVILYKEELHNPVYDSDVQIWYCTPILSSVYQSSI